MAARALQPRLLTSITKFPSSFHATPFPTAATRHILSPTFTQRRTFLQSLTSDGKPLTISASRLLPFPTYPIYSIIADIASYPTFLPLCTGATVTALSNPDAHFSRRWPQAAVLSVGLPAPYNLTESFTSSVTCVPPYPHAGRAGVGVVEALSGADVLAGLRDGSLSQNAGFEDEDVAHHDHKRPQPDEHSGPLAFLRTKWLVRSFPHKRGPDDGAKPQEADVEQDHSRTDVVEQTQVSLHIEYKFSNPLYNAMSMGVTPKVADRMVEAFEARVRKLLGGEGEVFGKRD